MEYLQSIPLERAFELAKGLLQDADTLVETATALLGRAAVEEESLPQIMNFLAQHSHPHEQITERVLELVEVCEEREARAVLGVLPALVGESAREVEAVLAVLSARPPALLLPVLAALSELALTESHKQEVLELATAALATVGEADVPLLTHTLLAAVSRATVARVVDTLRREVRQLEPSNLLLLLDTLRTALRLHPLLAPAFLRAFDASRVLSLLDVHILLLLLLHLPPAGRRRLLAHIQRWRSRSALPTAHLVAAVPCAPLPALLHLSAHLLPEGSPLAPFYTALFLLEPARTDLLTNLISACAGPDACAAATLLLALVRAHPNLVAAYATLLEETLYLSPPPAPTVAQPLCAALAELSAHSARLLDSLLIYARKNLYSPNAAHQEFALHLTGALLRNTPDPAPLIAWSQRFAHIDQFAPGLRAPPPSVLLLTVLEAYTQPKLPIGPPLLALLDQFALFTPFSAPRTFPADSRYIHCLTQGALRPHDAPVWAWRPFIARFPLASIARAAEVPAALLTCLLAHDPVQPLLLQAAFELPPLTDTASLHQRREAGWCALFSASIAAVLLNHAAQLRLTPAQFTQLALTMHQYRDQARDLARIVVEDDARSKRRGVQDPECATIASAAAQIDVRAEAVLAVLPSLPLDTDPRVLSALLPALQSARALWQPDSLTWLLKLAASAPSHVALVASLLLSRAADAEVAQCMRAAAAAVGARSVTAHLVSVATTVSLPLLALVCQLEPTQVAPLAFRALGPRPPPDARVDLALFGSAQFPIAVPTAHHSQYAVKASLLALLSVPFPPLPSSLPSPPSYSTPQHVPVRASLLAHLLHRIARLYDQDLEEDEDWATLTRATVRTYLEVLAPAVCALAASAPLPTALALVHALTSLLPQWAQFPQAVPLLLQHCIQLARVLVSRMEAQDEEEESEHVGSVSAVQRGLAQFSTSVKVSTLDLPALPTLARHTERLRLLLATLPPPPVPPPSPPPLSSAPWLAFARHLERGVVPDLPPDTPDLPVDPTVDLPEELNPGQLSPALDSEDEESFDDDVVVDPLAKFRELYGEESDMYKQAQSFLKGADSMHF